ncbi:hypothetical protein EGW08_019765 [Elysia chlorotica]|uniref:Uncharacterized protein n=1 Tax=Elysia chlorotica TaxID=188477 RepID=A0A433ST96_ELYCH|nr:hypothetical protein EGW08_019765 [Elysia chlorotica]
MTTVKSQRDDTALWEDTDKGRFGVSNDAGWFFTHELDNVVIAWLVVRWLLGRFSVSNDAGWFSTHELDSVYDAASLRGTTRLASHGGKLVGWQLDEKSPPRCKLAFPRRSWNRATSSSSMSLIVETLMVPYAPSTYRTGYQLRRAAQESADRRQHSGPGFSGMDTMVVEKGTQSDAQALYIPSSHRRAMDALSQSDAQALHIPSSQRRAIDTLDATSSVLDQSGQFGEPRGEMFNQQGTVFTERTSAYKKKVVEETVETSSL